MTSCSCAWSHCQLDPSHQPNQHPPANVASDLVILSPFFYEVSFSRDLTGLFQIQNIESSMNNKISLYQEHLHRVPLCNNARFHTYIDVIVSYIHSFIYVHAGSNWSVGLRHYHLLWLSHILPNLVYMTSSEFLSHPSFMQR